MKILNINIKMLSLALGLVALSSCTDDDLSGLDPLQKPIATTTVTSLNLAEGETTSILFTIDRPIAKPAQFKIELIDGNVDEEDIFAGDQLTDADTGIPGKGFEITVPAYATSFEIPVEIIRDLDQSEGNEATTLRISAAGVRTIITPEPYLIPLTISDFQYCLWTLDVFDDYGDSWQGAQVVLTQNGVRDVYPQGDWDDDAETYQIPVEIGVAYTFSYESGTTGTSSPNQAGPTGYEEENGYVLTSANGTVYTDGFVTGAGVIPTVGTIVSGANGCN